MYTYFVKCVAGLYFNPIATDISYAEVRPNFLSALTFAETEYDAPMGKIFVKWERTDEGILVSVTVPKGMKIKLIVGENEDLLEGGTHHKKY